MTERKALPFSDSQVSAGFPSPAEGYEGPKLDLNEYLILNPDATFLVRVAGDSMIGVGICAGDVLVVDCEIEPYHNAVVVAGVHGDYVVKRLRFTDGEVVLAPENDAFEPIKIGPRTPFEILGVVVGVCRKLHKNQQRLGLPAR